MIRKDEYLARLKSNASHFHDAQLDEIPRVSSVPSEAISVELENREPTLKSKQKLDPKNRVNLQPHKPKGDVDHVFLYLAPRTKPTLKDNYTVFVFTDSYKPYMLSDAAHEGARPFDSGGLVFQLIGWETDAIREQIEELTFQGKWKSLLGLYVDCMFQSADDYLRGTTPVNSDPLSLSKDDQWNFTWELLVRDEVAFEGSLVGVLDVYAPGAPTSLGIDATLRIQAKHDESRIIFWRADVSRSNVDHVLFELSRECLSLPGW